MVSATLTSTGSDSAGWRRWWRVHGTTWRQVAELTLEVARTRIDNMSGWNERAWHEAVEREAARIKRDPKTERRRTLLNSDISLERLWDEINNRAARSEAPETTYQASFYELSRHGVVRLFLPKCQRRLGDLSAQQFKRLMVALQQRRDQYPNISDELLTALAAIYDART